MVRATTNFHRVLFRLTRWQVPTTTSFHQGLTATDQPGQPCPTPPAWIRIKDFLVRLIILKLMSSTTLTQRRVDGWRKKLCDKMPKYSTTFQILAFVKFSQNRLFQVTMCCKSKFEGWAGKNGRGQAYLIARVLWSPHPYHH